MELIGSTPLVRACNLAALLIALAALSLMSWKVTVVLKEYLSAPTWIDRINTSVRCGGWIVLAMAIMWSVVWGVFAVNGVYFFAKVREATQQHPVWGRSGEMNGNH